jgi:hypothetical protein
MDGNDVFQRPADHFVVLCPTDIDSADNPPRINVLLKIIVF